MIGIDTNVLLRFLLADDPKQHEIVVDFFQQRSPESPAYISLFVFAEACWVMSRSYGLTNGAISGIFLGLMDSREIQFEDAGFIEELFKAPEFANFDIADYLVAEFAFLAGCEKTVTFDRDAVKHIPGMELLA